MANIQIIQGDFEKKLELPIAEGLKAGFPSPVEDYTAYFRYSIDECFVYLNGMEHLDLKAWGEELHKKIKRNVGMPVSIGLAPNKTLAKMASHFAKKYQGYRHCCMIDTDVKRIKALKTISHQHP
jgi:hypothetical protein